VFQKSLRKTLQSITPTKTTPTGAGRLPQTNRFPRFVLCTSRGSDDEHAHKVHWVLQQISDIITFPTPTCALADLTHMQTYFGTTERVLHTLQSACATSFASRSSEHHGTHFFIGSHLFRSLLFADHLMTQSIFAEEATEERIHILGTDNLQLRMLMRSLTWDQWRNGALTLLSLFPFSQQDLKNHVSALNRFVASMLNMRVLSPESARALWSMDEIRRRFGPLTAELWNRFCHQSTTHTLHGTVLKHTELPFDVRQFTGHSRDTGAYAEWSHLPLGDAVPVLLACFEESLKHLQAHFPLVPYGIRDFEALIRFTSGHSLNRRFLLNEPVRTYDRTSICILNQLFLSLFETKTHETKAAHMHGHSPFARISTSDGQITEGHCVPTPHGLGLIEPHEPNVAHLLNAIEAAQIVPLRICQMRQSTSDTADGLFSDHEPSCSEDLHVLRRELLAQNGIHTIQFQPRSSFRRPHATQPLPLPAEPTPSSDLFSHAFLHRPPAVLRHPLSFSLAQWRQELSRACRPTERRAAPTPALEHCHILETIDHHDFYLLTAHTLSYGLWLCAPVFQRDLPPLEKDWTLLGYFDALDQLPHWTLP
jgi:hypothetical protein